MLFEYLQQVQRLIADEAQEIVDPDNIIDFINRARRQVAMTAQCIRVVPPAAGQIVSTNLLNGGANYSNNPTVTITAPDFPTGGKLYPGGRQATAIATVIGGVIQAINVQDGGDGYFQPQITITDPTGSGAAATPNLSPINVTQFMQEIYNFKDVPLQNFPGVVSILNIRSVSFIYANWRYTTLMYAFSEYQAKIRRYPKDYVYVPAVCSQVGQGINGSLYMYPIPNAQFQMEMDCICLPIDLLTDRDAEAIPAPWTDAVPFMAAFYAFASIQNLNAASFYRQQFFDFMSMYSAGARPGMTPNRYGRY